jgi:hypothetical protein
MTYTVNLYDAKTNLSKLVDRAAAGEEIIIASRRPSWFRMSQSEKSAGSDRTCWESPIMPMILTDLCRPSFTSILSRFRAVTDRHAYPALGRMSDPA